MGLLINKLKGVSSFEVRFTYNPDFVSKLKKIPSARFDKPRSRWIIPLNNFEIFCDQFKGTSGVCGINAVTQAYLKLKKSVVSSISKKEAGLFKPDGFVGTLYDYQQVGTLAMLKNPRMLLADAPGVGKTCQAIALLSHDKTWTRSMVIAPASLILQWERELERFAPHIKTLLPNSSKDLPDLDVQTEPLVVIFNYEKLLIEREVIGIDENGKKKYEKYGAFFKVLASTNWDILIADEIQRVKNWKAKRTRLMKLFKSRRRYGLTGTPIENKLEDLYSIVSFLDPGFFGSWYDFDTRYIKREGQWKTIVGYNKLDEIRAMMPRIMLRRLKEEVMPSLPLLTLQNYYIEPNPRERALFEIIHEQMEADAAEFRQQLTFRAKGEENDVQSARSNLLAWITMSRQLCDSPELLTISDSKIAIEYLRKPAVGAESSKLKEAIRVVNDLVEAEEKVLIFTCFERMGRILNDRFKSLEMNPAFFRGGLTAKKRDAEVQKFVEDASCKVIVATDAMKEGVDGLQKVASYEIAYDLHWNPSVFDQKTGRLHRNKQTEKVTVSSLLIKDSIDEKIYHLLQEKRAISNQVLGDDSRLTDAMVKRRDNNELLKALGFNIEVNDGLEKQTA